MAEPAFGVWLPIETAPKDGTCVLLLLASRFHPRVHEGYYRSDIAYPEWDAPMLHRWLTASDVEAWMPLPPPPASQGEGE